MSGHSKWATIKRKKGATDAKRGRMFSKLIKEITVAARMGGGSPAGNPRLRRILDEARLMNMPADNITRAIKKGTGELEGVAYEGVGPGGSLIMVECLTDNRNRTAPELRKIFDLNGGTLGSAGAAGWAFDDKGVITLPKSAATEEQLFEVAVAAGAEDVRDLGEEWSILTPPGALDAVRDAIVAASITVTKAELAKLAKTPKVLGGADAEKAIALIDELDDHDDVQRVHSDIEIAEADLARLASA